MVSAGKRRLAAGAAAVVFLLGGALAAMAATGTGPISFAHGRPGHRSSSSGVVGIAARYLGISQARLRRELLAGSSLAAVAAATPGRSQAGLVAALEAGERRELAARAASLAARVRAEVKRPYGPGGLARGPAWSARAYLGLSATQLAAERRAGKSLAQIAQATPGRSRAGLIEALVHARREALAAATAAGALSRSELEARPAKVRSRVAKLVDRKPVAARGSRDAG